MASGDLSQQDHRGVQGRDPGAEEHHQHDGRPAERLRLGGDARGARGGHRRQAGRPGAGARRRRHLEGPDRQRQLDGQQPHGSGAQHRRGRDRRSRNGDLSKKITVDVSGEILQLKETINTMVDQLNAFASEVTRVAREVGTEGRLGGQAQVPRRGRHVEGPDRQRQLDGGQPDRAGAQHRRGDDRRGARRPVAQDHRRRARRDPAS